MKITAQSIAWWLLVTIAGLLISIAGGWVGSVNASVARVATLEINVAQVNAQYTEIIELLTRRSGG